MGKSIVKNEERRPSLSALVVYLLPCILGLGFARSAQAALSPATIMQSRNGFSDLSMSFRIIAMIVILAVLFAYGKQLQKRQVNGFMLINLFACMASLAGLFLAEVFGGPAPLCEAIYIVGIVASVYTLFYWFRRLRGCNPATVIVALCSARIVYEAATALMALADHTPLYLVGIAFLLLELGCIHWSRRQRPQDAPSTPLSSDNYFTIDGRIQDMRLLLFAILSCFLLSTAYDLIKSFPSGTAIDLLPLTRWGVAALAVGLLAIGVLTAFRGKSFTKVVCVFVGLFIGGAAAILLFAFSDSLQGGALLVTACNSLKDTLKWYIIVAFMSLGKRDPYIYAALAWLVFQSPVLVDTIMWNIAAAVEPGALGSEITGTLVTLLLVLAACAFIIGLSSVLTAQHQEEPAQPSGFIRSLIGEERPVSMGQLREEATAEEVRKMGRTFLLSEREVEVATLYVLGHTQSSIAEELCVSKTTVHTHIRHIYEKTEMHSRQDLLDYLKIYGS